MMRDMTVPEAVLQAYDLQPARVDPYGKGLINGTWLVETGDHRYILQCVNPVFPAGINRDIDCVTRHLALRGLVTAGSCRLYTAGYGTVSMTGPGAC